MNTLETFGKMMGALPYLLQGVEMTLQMAVLVLVLGTLAGLALALLRVYGSNAPSFLVVTYIRIIRGLPSLVILYMLYFSGSELFSLTAFSAAVLAMAVHSSAYQAEIFRSGLQSISEGQTEAARALGLSKTQCIISVILPQALRRSVPAWANEAAIVLKETSIAYVIGITELMRRGEYVVARTSQALLTYLIVGAIYFVLTSALTRGAAYAEARLKIPGV